MNRIVHRLACLFAFLLTAGLATAQDPKGTTSDSLTGKLRDTNVLKTVTVTGAKRYIIQKVDKTIVHIAGSPLAAGGTAWEVLLRAPGVTEQGSGLQLKGKKIIVLIDGRYTNLSGEDLKNMLSAMPANGIERIELMSNPSAKYEAQGGAVINIIMAKNTKLGTNGTATLGGRAGFYGSWNTGGSLNYRNKKMNAYGSYDYLSNQQWNESHFNRTLTGEKHLIDYARGKDQRKSHSFKAGLDYDLNKKNTVGILVKGMVNSIDRHTATLSMTDNPGIAFDSLSGVAADGEASYLIPSVNLHYKTILDSTGKELRFNADYFGYEKKWKDHFATRYYDPKGAQYATQFLRADAPASNDIRSFSVDYTHPLKKGSLEAGTKLSQATTDNDARWEKGTGSTWETDLAKSNHFIYRENVYAAYVTANRSFKKFSVMLGLRAEQTHTEGHSVTVQQTNTNNYFNLFPNASLQYEASGKDLFAFSYRKSIERYKYDIVNPFIIYKSQNSYYQGNPYLKPGIQHNFELSYACNNELFASLTYARFEDVLADVYRRDSLSPAVISTYDNLSSADYLEATITQAKAFFNNKWMTNNMLSIMYAKFNAPAGSALNNAKASALFTSDNTIFLPKGYRLQLAAVYYSPMVLGVMSYGERFTMNLGASKSVLEGKGTIALNVSDLFNSFETNYTVSSFGVQSTHYAKAESRFMKATFTYRFGNKNVKANTNRKNSIENETRRMQ